MENRLPHIFQIHSRKRLQRRTDKQFTGSDETVFKREAFEISSWVCRTLLKVVVLSFYPQIFSWNKMTSNAFFPFTPFVLRFRFAGNGRSLSRETRIPNYYGMSYCTTSKDSLSIFTKAQLQSLTHTMRTSQKSGSCDCSFQRTEDLKRLFLHLVLPIFNFFPFVRIPLSVELHTIFLTGAYARTFFRQK